MREGQAPPLLQDYSANRNYLHPEQLCGQIPFACIRKEDDDGLASVFFFVGKGQGSVEGCVLRVRLEGEEISARLLLEGREYKGASGRAMDFASFLISSGVTDPGVTLGRLVRERKQEAETVGDAIGRAIAWMSVLFDPGAVILEGEGFARPGCLAALEQAVKRETYYRGQLPFSIQTEEGKSSSPAI